MYGVTNRVTSRTGAKILKNRAPGRRRADNWPEIDHLCSKIGNWKRETGMSERGEGCFGTSVFSAVGFS